MLTHGEFRAIFFAFGGEAQETVLDPGVIREWLRHLKNCCVCETEWYADQYVLGVEPIEPEDPLSLPRRPSTKERYCWHRFLNRAHSVLHSVLPRSASAPA